MNTRPELELGIGKRGLVTRRGLPRGVAPRVHSALVFALCIFQVPKFVYSFTYLRYPTWLCNRLWKLLAGYGLAVYVETLSG
jgi:hypothetical protein